MATVTFQGQVVTVADLSCATVRPALTTAMNWQGYTATSCSANPVAVGTGITFVNQYGTPYTQNITAATFSGSTSTTCTSDTPFDYPYAVGMWSLAFCSVIGLYLISLKVSTVISLLRGR